MIAIALVIIYLLIAGIIDKVLEKQDYEYINILTAFIWPIILIALPFLGIAYLGYYITDKFYKWYEKR